MHFVLKHLNMRILGNVYYYFRKDLLFFSEKPLILFIVKYSRHLSFLMEKKIFECKTKTKKILSNFIYISSFDILNCEKR